MKKYLFVALSFLIFVSCDSNPEKIFRGQVKMVKEPGTDQLIGKKLHLDDSLYAGSPVVADSVISFVYRYPGYFVANFNINTGKHIGNFFNAGQGSNEFLNFNFLHPDVGNDYWINELNRRRYVLVNMATGEVKKRIDISEFKKRGDVPFIRAFILDDHQLIAVNQPEVKNLDGDIMPPKYWKIDFETMEEKDCYELYDEELYNKLRVQDPETESEHLHGTYHIKPDKSKMVNVMRYLYQINILDLKTNKLKGFRLVGSPGFEFVYAPTLPGLTEQRKYYYAAVDDSYIYVLLNVYDSEKLPIFHVFDWDGNLVRILTTDQKGRNFDLNRKNRKLYVKDYEENVWVYDVNYLYQ